LLGVGRVPTAGAFDPASLNPVVWLKADAHTASDGDPVTTAENFGSLGDFTQATSSVKPTYKTGIVNGKPVFRFDGVDDFLTGPDMSALTAATVFIVVKIDTDPPGTSTASGLWRFGTAGGGVTHFPFIDGTIYDSFGSTVRKTTVNPTPALTSFHVYEVKTVSGEWTSRLDGTQIFTTATNTVGFVANPMIGSSEGTTHFLDGDCAELFICDSGLGTTDAGNMRSHLGTKYAITIA
jgi:hypothetical protein